MEMERAAGLACTGCGDMPANRTSGSVTNRSRYVIPLRLRRPLAQYPDGVAVGAGWYDWDDWDDWYGVKQRYL